MERITLYDKKDLKNIPKDSKMIWCIINDIQISLIVNKNGKIIYPNDYPIDNKFRFGYEVFSDQNGLMGLYDIENERVALNFKYKSIECFGNIVEISEDEQTYLIIDLENPKDLSITNKNKTFPTIAEELKTRINLSKIELKDYMKLFPTPKTRYDLEKIGLWGAKVGVMEVPDGFEDIIEDSSMGTIEWNQYCSADIYDMSIELPVTFKKKNGEYVSLGIQHDKLILEKEYRDRLAKIKGLFVHEDNKQIFKQEKITKNEFHSKLLNENIVISLNFNKKHITREIITIITKEDGTTSRSINPFYTDTLKQNSKAKIYLNEKDDYFCIEGVGFDGGFNILDYEHYEQFDEDEKKAFHKFVDNAIKFLNSLFINKTFKNAYTMIPISEDKYKDFIKSLEDKNYLIEEVYNNSEQGRPATLEIFRASKKDEELRIVVFNDWLGEYELSLEYDKE